MINQYQAVLNFKQGLTADTYIYQFSLPQPQQLQFTAGQYLIMKINGQSRLYSIYSPDYIKDRFELLIKIVPGGLASEYLHKLTIGSQVNFQGPAGVFTLRENNRNKIFLATYTGLAPLRSMILSYLYKNQNKPIPKLYLFWGLRTSEDICLLSELKQLANNNRQFVFSICLSREQTLDKISQDDRQYFHLGRVNTVWEEFMLKTIKQYNNITIEQYINMFDYYLCGSRDVVESLNQFLLDKGINQQFIFFEKF